jgi:hypothetical protein
MKMREVVITITATTSLPKSDIKNILIDGLKLDFDDTDFETSKVEVAIGK